MKKGKKITKLHGKEYPKGTHMCATHVEHAEWGQGKPIHSQHAAPDENGQIDWYDVMFEHGIEKYVPTANMNVLAEGPHENHDHSDHEGEELEEKMDPTDHVKKKKSGKYCVYNKDGKIVKEFDTKKEADAYAIKNHKKLMTESVRGMFKMAGVKKPLTGKQRRKIAALLKGGDVRGAREAAKEAYGNYAQGPGNRYSGQNTIITGGRSARAGKPMADSVENDVESLISEYFSMYFQADLTESMDSISGDDVLTAIAELNTFTVTLNEAMDRKFSRAKIGTLGYYYNQHRKRGLDPNQAYAKAKDQASRSSSDTGDRRTASVKQFRGIKAGEEARMAYMNDIRSRGGSRIPGMTEAVRGVMLKLKPKPLSKPKKPAKVTPDQGLGRDARELLATGGKSIAIVGPRDAVGRPLNRSAGGISPRHAKAKAELLGKGRLPGLENPTLQQSATIRSHVEHDGPVLDEGSLGLKRMARKLRGQKKAMRRGEEIAKAAGVPLDKNPLVDAARRTDKIGGIRHKAAKGLRTMLNPNDTPVYSQHPSSIRTTPERITAKATDAVVAGATKKTSVADATRRARSIMQSRNPADKFTSPRIAVK